MAKVVGNGTLTEGEPKSTARVVAEEAPAYGSDGLDDRHESGKNVDHDLGEVIRGFCPSALRP